MPRPSVEDQMMLLVRKHGVPVSVLLDGRQWQAYIHPKELEEGVSGVGSGPDHALFSLEKKLALALKEAPARAANDES